MPQYGQEHDVCLTLSDFTEMSIEAQSDKPSAVKHSLLSLPDNSAVCGLLNLLGVRKKPHIAVLKEFDCVTVL